MINRRSRLLLNKDWDLLYMIELNAPLKKRSRLSNLVWVIICRIQKNQILYSIGPIILLQKLWRGWKGQLGPAKKELNLKYYQTNRKMNMNIRHPSSNVVLLKTGLHPPRITSKRMLKKPKTSPRKTSKRYLFLLFHSFWIAYVTLLLFY